MLETKHLLSAVDRLYEAVSSSPRWSAALDGLVDLVRADHALMVGRGGGAPFIVSARVDAGDLQRSLAAYDKIDHGPFAVSALPPGIVLTRSAVMSDRDYEMSEPYNEVIRPLGGYHGLIAHQQRTESGFAFTLCRTRQSGDFSPVDNALLQAVIPHLGNALALQSRLHVAEQRGLGLAQTIDRLATAVILTDASARPVLVNARASRIVDERDGLLLHGARLATATMAGTQQLHQSIGAAAVETFAGSQQLHVERAPPRMPLILNVLPISRLETGLTGTGAPRVAIFITEPDAPSDIDHAAVADLFCLTQRECETAMLLAAGLDPDEIAARLDLGIGTVRSHLKSVYSKTGARSQASLVTLLRGFVSPAK